MAQYSGIVALSSLLHAWGGFSNRRFWLSPECATLVTTGTTEIDCATCGIPATQGLRHVFSPFAQEDRHGNRHRHRPA